MPRRSEYAALRARRPETYPARYHEALAKLMSGSPEVVIGNPTFGDMERQRFMWCLFLQSWPEGTAQAEFLGGHLVRTKKTREASGLVMWATVRRRFTGEMLSALK